MGENGVRLKVLTPEGAALDMDADFVLLRTVDGDMGVLHGHERCAVMLDYGVVRAYTGRRLTGVLAVMSGFALIECASVTVITRLAERPDRVAEAAAELIRAREQGRHREKQADAELQRAEIALRHMLVDMDVSSYSVIKGHDEKPGR